MTSVKIPSRLKRKLAAKDHNEQIQKMEQTIEDILQHCYTIGKCQCGDVIFIYDKSTPENRYNYYCRNPDCSIGVRDVRKPDPNDFIDGGTEAVIELYKRLFDNFVYESL